MGWLRYTYLVKPHYNKLKFAIHKMYDMNIINLGKNFKVMFGWKDDEWFL